MICVTAPAGTVRYSQTGKTFPSRWSIRLGRERMEDDLVELARICLAHARITQAPRAAAALRRMAKEYQRRAALLRGGNGPRLASSAPRKRCRAPISGRSGILAGRPRTAAPHHARRSLHTQ